VAVAPPDKVCTLDEVTQITEQLRTSDKTAIRAHGAFDLLHLGHVCNLEAARKLGDILVVTVRSDWFVNKGQDRPVSSA
jgi:cytidyltransferase-like protein